MIPLSPTNLINKMNVSAGSYAVYWYQDFLARLKVILCVEVILSCLWRLQKFVYLCGFESHGKEKKTCTSSDEWRDR